MINYMYDMSYTRPPLNLSSISMHEEILLFVTMDSFRTQCIRGLVLLLLLLCGWEDTLLFPSL